jgi:diguanylate cyclase (GGDEF)-like protein
MTQTNPKGPLRGSRGAIFPIVAVTLVASVLALGLGWATLKQANEFAVEKQGDVLVRAIAAHGEQVGRQGIPQIFWQEAAEKVRERDLAWMDDNFGSYLLDILDYRQSYILDGKNEVVYAAVDGRRASPTRYDALASKISPWIDDVRSGRDLAERTGLIVEIKQYPDGAAAKLIVSTHTAALDGRPSLITISTIIPDLDFAGLGGELPYLLVGVADLDENVLAKIARDYGFSNLRWSSSERGDHANRTLLNDRGETVGVLSWMPELPAAEFIERLAPALAISLALLLFACWAAITAARSLAGARATAEELGYDAHHDALTGLANRRLFTEELRRGIDRHRVDGLPIALLSADLDRFKELNDGCGHVAGDEALQIVASRLRESAGQGALVARVGGDEFEIILSGKSSEDATATGARIIARVNEPIVLDGHIEWRLGCSIGIAFADGGDVDDLMRRAELAMSAAKSLGRNRLQGFEPAMDDQLKERISIERALRSALLHGYLSVDYQPVVESRSGKIVGAEALVRWRHPVLGLLTPDRFLAVAESTGLIAEIDHFVLARACEDAVGWGDISVSVNVSSQQILGADIIDEVRVILASTGLPAARLEIEMTEQALVVDEERATATIRGLRDIGVNVALDDVGAGYASLSQLRRLPFAKIKIDRTLTSDIGTKADANEIVFSLVRIGKALKMAVAGEGVETQAQQDFLAAAGCDTLQGFLFSRPVSADGLRDLLEASIPAGGAAAAG